MNFRKNPYYIKKVILILRKLDKNLIACSQVYIKNINNKINKM